jgi:hypothetical protein
MPSAARECPDCGHEFVVERRELQTVDGELVEVQRGNELPPVGPYMAGDIVQQYGTVGWEVFYQIVEVRGKDDLLAKYYEKSGKICPNGLYNISASNVIFVSRPDHRREQATAATLDELIAIGRRRKMKNPAGWARHVMAARSLRSGKARVRELVS